MHLYLTTSVQLKLMESAFVRRPLSYSNGIFSTISGQESIKYQQLIAKRNSQNRVAVQQVILLSLLNQLGMDITIAKPYKRSSATLSTFTVMKIDYNTRRVWDIRDARLKEYSSAKERKSYIDASLNRCLIDVLQHFNFVINLRNTRKSHEDSLCITRVESITYRDSVIIMKDSDDVGNQLHSLYCNRMMPTGLYIKHNDDEIASLLRRTQLDIPEQPMKSLVISTSDDHPTMMFA